MDRVYVEGTNVHSLLDPLEFVVTIDEEGFVEQADLDTSAEFELDEILYFEQLMTGDMWLEAVRSYVEKNGLVLCPHCKEGLSLYGDDADDTSVSVESGESLTMTEVETVPLDESGRDEGVPPFWYGE